MLDFPWAKDWPEITDERVRAAFARVPRTEFVPENLRKWADRDAPLPIGEDQTISQPLVVAMMTQALDLRPGDRVLEIGAGSGFQTAILCEMVAELGQPQGRTVYSVERHTTLAKAALTTLLRLGYQPHIQVGDGAAGWPEFAPYDAIIVTAAPAWLPRALWDQLAEGGRLIAPIGQDTTDQMLWLLRKTNRQMDAKSLGPVRFVPLISPLLNDPRQRLSIP